MSNFHEMDYTDGARRLVVRVDHELNKDELTYVLASWRLIHPEGVTMPIKAAAEEMVWKELDRRGRTSARSFRQPVTVEELKAVRWAEGVVAEHWSKVTRP